VINFNIRLDAHLKVKETLLHASADCILVTALPLLNPTVFLVSYSFSRNNLAVERKVIVPRVVS
jgi:hypothetical protein